MDQALVLTDCSLNVIASNVEADKLSAQPPIRKGSSLLQHFPELSDYLDPCEKLEVMEVVDLEGIRTCVRAIPVGEMVAFLFRYASHRALDLERRKSRRIGRRLRVSQHYLKLLLDASPSMVISFDGRGKIISFNRTAGNLLGYDPLRIIGRPVSMLVAAEDRGTFREAIAAPERWFGSFNMQRSDGGTFLTEAWCILVHLEDRDVAHLLIANDIDEMHRMRTSLIQSQKMGFMGELLCALAHQLNNPLVGVVNLADLVLNEMGPAHRYYRDVSLIRQAGATCQETVAGLLRFARRSGCKLEDEVDLVHSLEEVVKMLKYHDLFKTIVLDARITQVPAVRGDAVLLQQVFSNIMWNAAQAVGEGGRIEIECVYARARREVLISFADNGPGMSEDVCEHIFEPFFTTKSDGNGLGLALAYWIIKDHRGRIDVSRAGAGGSCFTIGLPAAREDL